MMAGVGKQLTVWTCSATLDVVGEPNQMFVVLLKFSSNRSQAGQFADGHNAWIKQGFDDGVFLLVGNLVPKLGGGILAHNISLSDLRTRLDEDPFVARDVVSAEIVEIAPNHTDERLVFLRADG